MALRDFKIEYKGNHFKIAAKYRKRGQELVFFIHGVGCRKEFFDFAFKSAQFDGFSLLAIDLVGFGASSKPREFSYAMEDQAEICRKLLGSLKPGKVHIVAHSMGGTIGLLLAEKIQNILGSFVSIEGNLTGDDCGFISRRTVSVSLEKFKARLFSQLRGEIAKSPGNGSKLWSESMEKSGPVSFYKSAASLVEWSDSGQLLKKLKGLSGRKIYVYGEKSKAIRSLARLDKIPKMRISGSGHFVMIDNPAEFYAKLAGFLEGRK